METLRHQDNDQRGYDQSSDMVQSEPIDSQVPIIPFGNFMGVELPEVMRNPLASDTPGVPAATLTGAKVDDPGSED